MTATRRDLVSGLLATPGLVFLTSRAPAQTAELPLALTPSCDDGHEATPSATEGPFYTPNSPLRQDVTAGLSGGMRLTVGGHVVDRSCRPVADALVELWQADEEGQYDRAGYRLRGHQRTDAAGRWSFRTIEPGLYPGRTRHIHFKVQRAGGRILTTQLYFPGEPGNARDSLYNRRLVFAIEKTDAERLARYDFVIA
jgi:protocatechuate 3,4-dioxygenase beta subunit